MLELLKKTETYKILNHRKEHMNHASLIIFDDKIAMPFFLKELSKLFFQNEKRISNLIDQKNFSDCVFLPKNESIFSVEDAEQIAEESSMQSLEGKIKLFVVFDFSFATTQAQNKLLKILEEPPTGIYFLFGATTPYSILPTIISRMEVFYLQPFGTKDLCDYISRNYPDVKNSSFFVAESGGYPGKINEILKNSNFDILKEKAFSLFESEKGNFSFTVKKIGDISEKKQFLSLLNSITRDILFIKKSGYSKNQFTEFLLFPSEVEREIVLSNKYSTSDLISLLSLLSKGEKELNFNSNLTMIIENCFINLIK